MFRKILAVLFVNLLLVIVGCSDGPTDTTPQTENPNLEDQFGGYLATSEDPGFGDPALTSESDDIEDYGDPMLTSPGADSVINDEAGSLYHLRVLWGKLRYDSTVTEITDWSGSLSVSRGAVIIRRAIRFELGQDYIPTRTERESFEWVSYTTVHNDGIGVDIYVPADTIDGMDPVTVSFESGPYSRVFTLDELEKLDTIVTLEDSNNVAFNSFKLDHRPCPRGFMSGRWGYDADGNGVFRGLWMNKRGMGAGFVKGHFGVDDDGNQVFYGKWVSLNGRFEGFIKGYWGANPNDNASDTARRHATGWFSGAIFNADGAEIGVLEGKYKSHPKYQQGFFGARWKLRCSETEPDVDDSEEGF